jgi:hypothetical protein
MAQIARNVYLANCGGGSEIMQNAFINAECTMQNAEWAARGSALDTGNNLEKWPLRGRKAGLRRELTLEGLVLPLLAEWKLKNFVLKFIWCCALKFLCFMVVYK